MFDINLLIWLNQASFGIYQNQMEPKRPSHKNDDIGQLPVISSPADFRAKGVNMTAWAKERGFNVSLVYAIVKGQRKSLRGQSFQIALELGLKRRD